MRLLHPCLQLKLSRHSSNIVDAGEPLHMAVFTRQESHGRLHCEGTAYFSAARSWLTPLMRNPVKTSVTDLTLLSGDRRAWSVLFPEKE